MAIVHIFDSVCILLILCGLDKIPNKAKLVHPILVLRSLKMCVVQSFQLGKRTVQRNDYKPKLTMTFTPMMREYDLLPTTVD